MEYAEQGPIKGEEGRDPDVNVAAVRLRNSLERLDETVARIADRLSPVLGPEAKANATACPPPGGTCVVSAEMYTASHRVDAKTYHLRELLDRLEV